MFISGIIAFVVGALTIIQAGLNKKINITEGIASAVALGGLVLLAVSLLVFFVQKYQLVPFPENLRSQHLFQVKKWWYLFPGVCGFLIVIGFTYSIIHLGAARTAVIAIAGQCLGGVCWDIFVEHNSPSLIKVVGVFVTIVGAILVNF